MAPVPKAICAGRELHAGGIWQAARGGIFGGKQDGLEQMNVVRPKGCMSFSWSVSKMS